MSTRPRPRERTLAVTVAPRTVLLFVGTTFGALALFAFAYAARAVLIQLVVAVVLAMAAEPLVQALERRGLRRGAAVGISFAVTAAALIGLAYLVLAPLVDEVRQFVHDAPRLREELAHGRGHLGFL